MPRITVNGCQYYYEDTGSGSETILFGHGFLVTHRVWEYQIEALRDRYRCIALDWRGQGWSEVTKDGYSVLELCEDVLQFVEHLDLGSCHYVGLSMGGFVGFRLLLRNPDWLRSAALLETRAEAETRNARLRYEAMLFTARYIGYGPVLDRAMQLLFGPAFLNDPANEREVERWRGIIASNEPLGVYRAGKGIFRRPNVLPLLGAIRTPTLLVAGADDVVTPMECARRAQHAIPDAELAVIPAAGHSSPVERPEAVTNALDAFITSHSATPVT